MRSELRRLPWAAAFLVCHCALGEPAPYPRDDHATTVEDQSMEIDVLDNDVGDVDSIAFSTGNQAFGRDAFGSGPVRMKTEHGLVTLQADDRVLYTPDLDYQGEDHFFYVATNDGGSARARVTVDIEADGQQLGDPAALRTSDFLMRPFAAMLDADELPDLVVQDGDRVVALLQRTDATVLAVDVAGEPGCCTRFDDPLLVTDLDGDGRSDLVLFDEDPSLRVAFSRAGNEAEPLVFEEHTIDYEGSKASVLGSLPSNAWPDRATAGDFDGDGEMDLAVGFGLYRGLIMHLAFGAEVPPESFLLDSPETDAMASGDVNDDGIDDIVVLTPRGTVEVIYADATQATGFGRATIFVGAHAARPMLAVADLDQRAGDEIVIADGVELVVVYAKRAARNLDLTVATSANEIAYFALGDVTGDGRVDIVGAGLDSPWALEVWRGATRDGVPGFVFAADFLRGVITAPAVLDFDRDGTKDVVVARRREDEDKDEEWTKLVWLRGHRDPDSRP